MSYPRDLDEVPQNELLQELARRQIMRDQDLCDYCGRYGGEPCRFAERHRRAEREAFDEVEPSERYGVPTQRDESFDHCVEGLPF